MFILKKVIDGHDFGYYQTVISFIRKFPNIDWKYRITILTIIHIIIFMVLLPLIAIPINGHWAYWIHMLYALIIQTLFVMLVIISKLCYCRKYDVVTEEDISLV
jgi:hypothetical protein